QWGGRIRELALDSTWSTNGSRYELYALLGEVYGSGLPLGFLLLRSSPEGEKGGKERFLTAFLTAVRDEWHIEAVFTLTDKDWSEINAFRATYPHAKHQLCYWHCLRAIKTRLSILRRMPAYYNAEEAHKEFSWIDEDFVPSQQRTDTDGEKRSVDPEYIFCPAPHRKQLLHLFTKHFCQHSFFPEPGIPPESHTSESIRRGAVFEMYTFCHERGLAEVWGYMWTSWYSPRRWPLWARSTSEDRISRLRTTMTVEKFWQQLKGDYLKHLKRPRLDQLLYILIYRVTP
ncbi:hypothetical protein OH76DRAFT_1314939, partial [Lentinus brumalis]